MASDAESTFPEPPANHEVDPRPGNWPRFCVGKLQCFHHDIDEEVPEHNHRVIIKRMYTTLWVGAAAVVLNFAAVASRLGTDAELTLPDFFLGMFYIPLFIVASTFIYFAAYSVGRTRNPLHLRLFYIGFVIQILGEVLLSLGIPGTGSGAFYAMIKMFGLRVGSGVVCLLCFLLWLVVDLLNVVNFISWYRRSIDSEGADPYRQDDKPLQDYSDNANTATDTTALLGDQNRPTSMYDNNSTPFDQVSSSVKARATTAIVDIAKDNKEVIAKAVMDNKEAVANFVWQNKDTVAQGAAAAGKIVFGGNYQ